MTEQQSMRHCIRKECDLYEEGKQVPCRLYELDLLHGREKLTSLEVRDGQTNSGDECRYQLPLFAQTSAKYKSRASLASLKGLDSDRGSHLLACNPE